MYLTGGPLSQYYHALLFKLFGVSFLTLIISNLAIGLGLQLLMYRRFLACSDAWTATTIYNTGDKVTYQGATYQAKWYTRNQTPGDTKGPWQKIS